MIIGCRRSQSNCLFNNNICSKQPPSQLEKCADVCMGSDLQRVQNAVAVQNTPLWFGEWAISTDFNATDEFMKQWADAQKLMYSKSAGWIVSLLHTTGWRRGPLMIGRSCSSGTSKLKILPVFMACKSNGMKKRSSNQNSFLCLH
jgi:hypothetical protein